MGIGGLGLGVLLLGAYVLFGSVSRFFDPEKWFATHHAVRLLTSWNVIWRFLLYMAASLAITGVAILFFSFSWPGWARTMNESEIRLTKNLAAGVAAAGMLLFPVVGFFYLFTLPIVSLSAAVYWLGVAAIAVLFIVFIFVYRVFLSPRPRFGAVPFLLFLAVFLLMIVGDQITLVNATREHTAELVADAEEREAEIDMEREAARAAVVAPDVVRGEEVFKTVCMTCHRMDERLVGPPLGTVLPKYADDMDRLVAFVQKPSKVNPDYPPMPAPGLPLFDVKSVAAYLLGRISAEPEPAPSGAPGEANEDREDEGH
ncbi:MAG: c-type cytochrome [bacterium]